MSIQPARGAADPHPSAADDHLSPAPATTGDAAGADALLPPASPRRPAPDGVLRVRHGRGGRRRALLRGLVVPSLLIAVWAVLSATGLLSERLFPPPLDVLQGARRFVLGPERDLLPGVVPFDGAVWRNVGASLSLLLSAYGVAVAVGVPLGVALGSSRVAADLLDPVVNALRAIPIFAWLPLAVVWFGLGADSARFLVFVGAVFPIVVATADATARVPTSYLETAAMLGAPRRALPVRVVLPAALPGIVTGMRLGLSLGWMSVVVGELTGTRSGVGAMMLASRESGRLDEVIVGMITFAVLGLTGDLLLRLLSSRATRWARG